MPRGPAGTTLAPVSTATPPETVPTTAAAQPEAPPERGWFRPWMLLFPLVPAGLMLAVIVGLTQGERPITQRFFAQVRLGRGPAAAALATDALAAEVQQCLLSACETGASAPALRLLQAGAHEDLQRVVPTGDGAACVAGRLSTATAQHTLTVQLRKVGRAWRVDGLRLDDPAGCGP